MTIGLKKPVLFFSSLVHGGGRTFAETYAHSLREADITLSSLYDTEFTKDLARRLGLRAKNILDPRILLDPRTLVLSNSQACAAIASLFYPTRHYYITHGYANGLSYAATWRRLLWVMQINMPGTHIIACGDSECRAVNRLRLDKSRISLIRNGLPLKILQSGDADVYVRGGFTVHFAYIGRIAFQKGLDVLLRALNHADLCQYNIVLSVIGNYQEHEHEYCAQIHQLIEGSSATINLLPPQQIDASFLRRFSALISPSRFEGLPYTVLEAAHAGTPIVLSDCPGNHDIAPDDRYAYIFSNEDEASLAHAIVAFLESSPAEVAQRVGLMQERVSREFSAANFRDEYLKLLR